jgi:hypothetical protein
VASSGRGKDWGLFAINCITANYNIVLHIEIAMLRGVILSFLLGSTHLLVVITTGPTRNGSTRWQIIQTSLPNGNIDRARGSNGGCSSRSKHRPRILETDITRPREPSLSSVHSSDIGMQQANTTSGLSLPPATRISPTSRRVSAQLNR